MGAFDKSINEYERFGDKFKVGDTFTVRTLRVGPVIDTEYGESPTFIIDVNGTEYAGFGIGIVGQARTQEDGDFPRECTLVLKPTKRGNMKQLVPASNVPADAVTVPSGAADDNGNDIPF